MKKYFGLILLLLIAGLQLANSAEEPAAAKDAGHGDDKAKIERFIAEVRTQGVELLRKYGGDKITPDFEKQFCEGVKDFVWDFYHRFPKLTIKFIDQYFSRKDKKAGHHLQT